MNKNELINNISEKSGFAKRDSEVVLDAIVETIMGAVASGDNVKLVGFGSFELKECAARTGRNPKTGEGIEIPAKKRPIFKAGKDFKAACN